jgi:hypothetical protein
MMTTWITSANAVDVNNICIFKNSQRSSHSVKIQTRDCQEYLKVKDCQENWQVEDMYKYANLLTQIAKENSMTPYKAATNKNRDNCHEENGRFKITDKLCNAMVAKEVILSYAPSNCEQLACLNAKQEEKIFNQLVKRYNKCHAYSEKQRKQAPPYVVDAKPMTEEEYEKTLSPEELIEKQRKDNLSEQYFSGKYFPAEEKMKLLQEGIGKKELYFQDITKEKAKIIMDAYPNDEDTIRKNVVGGSQPFYNFADFMEAAKCINVPIEDNDEIMTLDEVILNIGQVYILKNKDYFVSVKNPEEVKWVAKKLDEVNNDCMLKIFKEKNKHLERLPPYWTEDEYEFFVKNFENYKEFWKQAAKDKKYMLFVTDLY